MAVTLYEMKRVAEADLECRRYRDSIERLRESMTSLQVGSDGMPHAQRKEDKFAAYVAKLDELEALYCERMVWLEEERARINTELDKLESIDASIVYMRVFQGKQWEAIAYRVKFSERTCRRRYKSALVTMSR